MAQLVSCTIIVFVLGTLMVMDVATSLAGQTGSAQLLAGQQIERDEAAVAADSEKSNKSQQSFKVSQLNESELSGSLLSDYAVDSIHTYTIPIVDDVEYELTVAKYVDQIGEKRQAIVYLPPETDAKGKVVNSEELPQMFRFDKWKNTAEAIKKYTDPDSLFVTYWDNGQRVHFLTGRTSWATNPTQLSYSSNEKELWRALAGGFENNGNSERFSRVLLMNYKVGIDEIKKMAAGNQHVYLLAGLDDLSHVQEIAKINGKGLPLETRIFPTNSDLHNSISQVKEWAKEDGATGSYLVQAISDQFYRAWRITEKEFEDTLLARTLPFTSSLDRELDTLKLVYQSDWGGYLKIFEVL